MSAARYSAAVYRRLLWLYPRRFREEYGNDLVLLFCDQLRDEPAGRVCGRAAVDLALTVPTRHAEARMQRPPSTLVPILFATLALALFAVVGLGGSAPASALLLVPAVLSAVLAVSAWRRSRPIVDAELSDRWLRFLAAGVGLLAFEIIVTTITGELPEGGWFIAMAGLLTSFGLIITGMGLGAYRLSGRQRGRLAP